VKNKKITIITGLSGSGKTTAINALEDAGFFCIDNLPIILLPKFLELRTETNSEITKLALVMDLREKEFLQRYPEIFQKLMFLQRDYYQQDMLNAKTTPILFH